MRFSKYIFAGISLVGVAFGAVYLLGYHPGGKRTDVFSAATWERMASPGALSHAHTFLEHNCAACHTAGKGVETSSCIACHANSESLLQRQPTAFHANVSSCVECHREHRGMDRRPTDMDHRALAEIGFRQLWVCTASRVSSSAVNVAPMRLPWLASAERTVSRSCIYFGTIKNTIRKI